MTSKSTLSSTHSTTYTVLYVISLLIAIMTAKVKGLLTNVINERYQALLEGGERKRWE